MGARESKEEVIISQAGNSGGVSDDAKASGRGCSLLEVIGIVSAFLIIVLLLYCGYRIIRKRLEIKIRREITKSRDLSAV